MAERVPLPSEIEVAYRPNALRFHQTRSGAYGPQLIRCGLFISERVLAGVAIEQGALPCQRCFPYDPIETWEPV